MADMTEQEALAILRQIKGLRDAFMGFDAVVKKVGELIAIIEASRQTVLANEKKVQQLMADIGALEQKKLRYADMEQAERLKYEASMETMRAEIHLTQNELTDMGKLTKEELATRQEQIDILDKTIAPKKAELDELKQGFEAFRRSHGL